MNDALRQQVWSRAENRCEYCLLPQSAVIATFHIDHTRAIQHGGSDDLGNLALACDRCNLFKGTNLTSIDPDNGQVVALFNPRLHKWSDHFKQYGYEIIGISSIGRASVRLLKMNAANRVDLRTELGLILLKPAS
jgi:hypothetical protein